MAVKNNIHNVVFFHRKQAGLNRNDLATLAGVGKTAIYDLEKGKTTLRWSTVQAILNALNISINFSSPLMNKYEESIGKDT